MGIDHYYYYYVLFMYYFSIYLSLYFFKLNFHSRDRSMGQSVTKKGGNTEHLYRATFGECRSEVSPNPSPPAVVGWRKHSPIPQIKLSCHSISASLISCELTIIFEHSCYLQFHLAEVCFAILKPLSCLIRLSVVYAVSLQNSSRCLNALIQK